MFIDTILAAAAVASAERGLQLIARKAATARGGALDVARSLQRLRRRRPAAAARRSTWRSSGSADLPGPGHCHRRRRHGRPPAGWRVPPSASTTAPRPGPSPQLADRQGRRRIRPVIAGPQDHSDGVERLKDAAHAPGAATGPRPWPTTSVIEGRFTFESGAGGRRATAGPGARRPTTVVAANDDMAAAALWTAHRQRPDPTPRPGGDGFRRHPAGRPGSWPPDHGAPADRPDDRRRPRPPAGRPAARSRARRARSTSWRPISLVERASA